MGCLSRMRGNLHVRFLGEGAAARPPPYPRDDEGSIPFTRSSRIPQKGQPPTGWPFFFSGAHWAYEACLQFTTFRWAEQIEDGLIFSRFPLNY